MKTFIFVSLLAIGAAVSAQSNFEAKTSSGGGGFDVTSGVATNDKFVVDGKQFDILKTSSGARYVVAVGKSGAGYPVWIGTPTEDEFEGRRVHVTRNGSYCVYLLGKSGFPYAKWLNKTA
jgi:hypothetical protein